MEWEIVLFFWRQVVRVKRNFSDILCEESQVEWCERHIQCEFRIDEGKVTNTNQVFARVANIESTGDSFERCAAVPRCEVALDRKRISECLNAVDGDEQYVSNRVGCFASQCIERSRDVGLSNQLSNIEFCIIDPFVAYAPCWHIDVLVPTLCIHGTMLFCEVTARSDHCPEG